MEKFRVTAAEGITHNGEHYEKGKTLMLHAGATRNAFLHFKQVAKVEGKEKDEAEEIKEADEKVQQAENKDLGLKGAVKTVKK